MSAGSNTVPFDFSGAKPVGSAVVERLLQTDADSVPAFESALCPGDINRDNVVDALDLNLVRAAFGQRCSAAGYNAAADVNSDCIVDVRDLSYVAQNVGCRAL